MSGGSDDRYSAIRSVPPRTSSGTIVVKATCDDEIRRIPILNQELTFEELCFMMHRLFRDRLSGNLQNMILKYTDEDGDLVTLTDSLDVSHALERSNVLRVTVFDKEVLPANSLPRGAILEEIKNLNLTPKRASSLRDSLVQIQKQLDSIIKTYCSEDKQEEPSSTSAPAATAPAKENKPTLSTADLADLLETKKPAANLSIDYSKRIPYEGYDKVQQNPGGDAPSSLAGFQQHPQQQPSRTPTATPPPASPSPSSQGFSHHGGPSGAPPASSPSYSQYPANPQYGPGQGHSAHYAPPSVSPSPGQQYGAPKYPAPSSAPPPSRGYEHPGPGQFQPGQYPQQQQQQPPPHGSYQQQPRSYAPGPYNQHG